MKKKVFAILAVIVLLTTGCGGNKVSTEHKLEDFKNDLGSVQTSDVINVLEEEHITSAVVVKNTSNKTIRIKNARFTFEDKEGMILASEGATGIGPSIIGPGETSYVSTRAELKGVSQKFKVATVDLDYYNASEKDIAIRTKFEFDKLSMLDRGMGNIITGKITNKSTKVYPWIVIQLVLKDNEGKILTVVSHDVMESLSPNKTRSFEADLLFIPDSIISKTKDIEAYGVAVNTEGK